MRILLLGRDGQIGFELQRSLAPLGEIVALGHADLDLADPAAIRRGVRESRPDLIVNAAAYTAVDRAEREPEAAHAVNGVAPGVLGEEAARLEIPVVHYSTDYVFDGRLDRPYAEIDRPNPLGIYGASKLAGERALAAATGRHLIFRTSWVFGARGANFTTTMLRLAAERERIEVVDDQIGAPTPAALVADVSAQILGQYRRPGAVDFPFGLYHLAAGGATSWHGYAQAVLAAAEAAGRRLRVKAADIRPVRTADYPTPAARPLNSRLDTSRLQRSFGLCLPPWQAGLAHVLQQLL